MAKVKLLIPSLGSEITIQEKTISFDSEGFSEVDSEMAEYLKENFEGLFLVFDTEKEEESEVKRGRKPKE